MQKYARLDKSQNNIVVGEVISYNPKEVINEQLWDRFVPCPDNVIIGFNYDENSKKFYLPEGFGKSSLESETLTRIEEGFTLDENQVIVPDPDYKPVDLQNPII